jgi:hypothetical protein
MCFLHVTVISNMTKLSIRGSTAYGQFWSARLYERSSFFFMLLVLLSEWADRIPPASLSLSLSLSLSAATYPLQRKGRLWHCVWYFRDAASEEEKERRERRKEGKEMGGGEGGPAYARALPVGFTCSQAMEACTRSSSRPEFE